MPNSGEDTEKLDHTDIAGGDVKNGPATLENSVASSQKTKYARAIRPCNPTQGCVSHGNENSHSYKNMYANVHSGFLHNTKIPETARCSGGWPNAPAASVQRDPATRQ